jgi:prolyl oligopeptidase
VRNRYFYLKRRIGEERPQICMREGLNGVEQVLVDPATRCGDRYISVRILRIARDGGLLAYEVRKGGERLCEVEFLDLTTSQVLPDKLARGFLTSLELAPDGSGFYYVHVEPGSPESIIKPSASINSAIRSEKTRKFLWLGKARC